MKRDVPSNTTVCVPPGALAEPVEADADLLTVMTIQAQAR